MSGKLVQSTLAVGGMTALSRILGFVRDMVIAHVFGAGAQVDAYIVAFRIPNLLRRLFAEGAFSQAFVPVLTERRKSIDAGADSERLFIESVTGHLAIWVVLIALAGMVAAPLLAILFAPGFVREVGLFQLTVNLIRITFPYIFFISLVALAAGVLNIHGRFALPAFAPVLLNVAIIAAALVLAPLLSEPISALAWGILGGGAGQLLLLGAGLYSIGMLPRLRLCKPDTATRKLFRLMVPALFGGAITQISLVINTVMASFLVSGSVSWLYYSDRLMEFPLGIFTLAISTVALPNLARAYVHENRDHFQALLDWALRWIVMVCVPAAAALMTLSVPVLASLFLGGRFGATDVLMASRSLGAYAPALLGLSCVKVLAPAFYARQDIVTPVRIGLLTIVINTLLNLMLAPCFGHVGLAWGTTLASACNAGLLFWALYRHQVYTPAAGWGRFLLKIGLAVLVMSVLVAWLAGNPSDWLVATSPMRLQRLVLVVGCGLMSYLAILWATGLRWSHMTAPSTAV